MSVPNRASSGHLRRCSDADTSNKRLSRDEDASILSWPTIMGHYKLLIAIFTALDTYGARVELMSVPNRASSGHLRRCRDVDTSNKRLSFDEDASILSWPTIMGHYKLLIAIFTALDTYGARVALMSVPNRASSGHLRRCSDADTSNKRLIFKDDASILSRPTIMGH
eukprot:scaffold11070_cov164-Skeletonema_dohrnii-CCMP3373.AAC.5